MAPDISDAAAASSATTATSTATKIVRIKRKRDEPALPEFVLAAKRPSLIDRVAGLNRSPGTAAERVAAFAAEARQPPQEQSVRTRYKLVGTASVRGGAAVADPAALAAAREQKLQLSRDAARFKRLTRLRGSADSAADDGVLELQTCASADAEAKAKAAKAAANAKPKLVPFGPPLPKPDRSPKPAEKQVKTNSGGVISEADLWAEMTAASAMDAEEAAAAKAKKAAEADADDDYVYDEYALEEEVVSPSAIVGMARENEAHGWMPPEIYWEEELVADDLMGENGGEGNGAYDDEDYDSNGEVDYPDMKAECSDSDEEAYCSELPRRML